MTDPGAMGKRSLPVQTLRWGAGLVIVTVAVMRCVVIFAPQIVFDVDPAVDPSPLAGLGPAGSLLLDCIALAACALGIYGETLDGRGVERRLMLLALLPVPVVIWHGAVDLGDLWRGSTWVAAAASCVVLAHLARDRTLRVILAALLIGVLVPVVVRGTLQSAVSFGAVSISGPEHAQLLAEFETGRDVFYEDRGWAEDSPAAHIYERRLRQPQPRGWFPTTNLFASLMAFGVVLCIGLTPAAGVLGRGWRVGFVIGAVVAGLGLVLAGSKGAFGAMLAGVGLLAAGLYAARGRPAAWGSRGAVALLGVVVVGVAIRGAVLPESLLGEKSLLFRWHYLVGATQIVTTHALEGVGPDGFQEAYMRVRPPRSPEEVTTAHSFAADWLADLGVLGAAWIGLVVLCVWRAGARLVGVTTIDASTGPVVGEKTPLVAAAAVVIFGLMPMLALEFPGLGGLSVEVARGIGLAGYVVVAAGLAVALARLPADAVDRALAAGAVTLVIHGLIEMTFFDPGSVTWVMCLVGLAAVARPGRTSWVGSLSAVALLALAVWVGTIWVPRARRGQTLMVEAARVVAAQEPDAATARVEGAGILVVASEQTGTDARPIEEAARQLIVAARRSPPTRRRALLAEAIELAERAVVEHGRPSSLALACDAWWFMAAESGDAGDRDTAILFAERLTELDPGGIGAWVLLGDLYWETARPLEAAAAYRRALVADRNFELDPLKQLSDRERRRLGERLDDVSQEG